MSSNRTDNGRAPLGSVPRHQGPISRSGQGQGRTDNGRAPVGLPNTGKGNVTSTHTTDASKGQTRPLTGGTVPTQGNTRSYTQGRIKAPITKLTER